MERPQSMVGYVWAFAEKNHCRAAFDHRHGQRGRFRVQSYLVTHFEELEVGIDTCCTRDVTSHHVLQSAIAVETRTLLAYLN